MNLLARIKSKNIYNYITDSLYKADQLDPITDVEGDTALLTTDGTSWQLNNGEWERIEQNVDARLCCALYPFLSSVCQSIHNAFIEYSLGVCCKDITFSYKSETDKSVVVINGITEPIDYVVGDFIFIKTRVNEYLTRVVKNENGVLEIDNLGVDVRISGGIEAIHVFLVSFPPSFLSTVLDMLGYDFFIRDSKEKRQERLGNYTYTNFEPNTYYGDEAYPKEMQNAIKYWQRVYL